MNSDPTSNLSALHDMCSVHGVSLYVNFVSLRRRQMEGNDEEPLGQTHIATQQGAQREAHEELAGSAGAPGAAVMEQQQQQQGAAQGGQERTQAGQVLRMTGARKRKIKLDVADGQPNTQLPGADHIIISVAVPNVNVTVSPMNGTLQLIQNCFSWEVLFWTHEFVSNNINICPPGSCILSSESSKVGRTKPKAAATPKPEIFFADIVHPRLRPRSRRHSIAAQGPHPAAQGAQGSKACQEGKMVVPVPGPGCRGVPRGGAADSRRTGAAGRRLLGQRLPLSPARTGPQPAATVPQCSTADHHCCTTQGR